MKATEHTPSRSLGAELERVRLERRARRMTVAIASLHLLANERGRELGATPRHLHRTLADFETQIDAMNGRLRELAWERPSQANPAMTTPMSTASAYRMRSKTSISRAATK
jgi:hypothetical protein